MAQNKIREESVAKVGMLTTMSPEVEIAKLLRFVDAGNRQFKGDLWQLIETGNDKLASLYQEMNIDGDKIDAMLAYQTDTKLGLQFQITTDKTVLDDKAHELFKEIYDYTIYIAGGKIFITGDLPADQFEGNEDSFHTTYVLPMLREIRKLLMHEDIRGM